MKPFAPVTIDARRGDTVRAFIGNTKCTVSRTSTIRVHVSVNAFIGRPLQYCGLHRAVVLV